MIDSVVSAQNGWLAIHSTDADSSVIGAAFVHAGVNRQVQIMISTDYLTDTVKAILHIDAGQSGIYEFPDPDVPVKDARGNIIAPSVKIETTHQPDQTVPSDSIAAVVSAIIVFLLLIFLMLSLWKRQRQNRKLSS
jgi:hypothetical protein